MVPFQRRDGRHRRRSLVLVAALAVSLLVPSAALGAPSSTGRAHRSVDLQLLAFNDFHGNLEPPSGSSGRITTADRAGQRGRRRVPGHAPRGAPRAEPNSITVSAGDLIGASPLISALLPRRADHRGDERASGCDRIRRQPRVRRGLGRAAAHAERRLPSRIDGCPDGDLPSPGADFQYLSANVVRRRHRQDPLPGLRGAQDRRRPRRLHRHDARGDADHRHPGRRRRPDVPRRGRDRQRARQEARAQGSASRPSWSSSTRAASQSGALASTTSASGSPGAMVDIVGGLTRRSTSSSRGHTNSPTTAASPASWSPARARSAAWSRTSTSPSTARPVT